MDFAAIMSKVMPGTFAPDMGGSEAPAISPIPKIGKAAGGADATDSAASAIPGATSFKDTVKQMLADVNDKLQTSDANTRDLATGKTHDINTVVTSVEEANLALEYTMAIRTKLLDAYSEIERMTV